VTPPASERGNCGSCGHTECSTHTFAVTGFVASFTSFVCVPFSDGTPPAPMCECVSMMPGVTYLPVPSITTASPGALTFAPTAAILPSRSRTLPFRIVGPAAVRMVTLRMSVVRDGKGLYVLGNGLSFGTDTPPSEAARRAVESVAALRFGVVVVTGAGAGAALVWPVQATNPTASAMAK